MFSRDNYQVTRVEGNVAYVQTPNPNWSYTYSLAKDKMVEYAIPADCLFPSDNWKEVFNKVTRSNEENCNAIVDWLNENLTAYADGSLGRPTLELMIADFRECDDEITRKFSHLSNARLRSLMTTHAYLGQVVGYHLCEGIGFEKVERARARGALPNLLTTKACFENAKRAKRIRECKNYIKENEEKIEELQGDLPGVEADLDAWLFNFDLIQKAKLEKGSDLKKLNNLENLILGTEDWTSGCEKPTTIAHCRAKKEEIDKDIADRQERIRKYTDEIENLEKVVSIF